MQKGKADVELGFHQMKGGVACFVSIQFPLHFTEGAEGFNSVMKAGC
jgi:hypothetical protein